MDVTIMTFKYLFDMKSGKQAAREGIYIDWFAAFPGLRSASTADDTFHKNPSFAKGIFIHVL